MTDSSIVEGQHAKIGVREQTDARENHTAHPDAQWFGSAGLGVFLHWGISSVNGDGDLSWSMMRQPSGEQQRRAERYGPFAIQRIVSPAEYWKQAEYFLAERYDALAWLTAMKAAGIRYAVLTTKHHDGFALWPSAYGDFNTRKYLGGRDLVGEFVDACRACDLRVGLYYSPPDWWFDRDVMSFAYGSNEPRLDMHHRPAATVSLTDARRAAHDRSHRELVQSQTEELLTRYGRIDVLWFDGDADGAIGLDRIRDLQPAIVVNRRGLGADDFETPECRFPSEHIPGWWEYCHIWNDGAWGYLKHETYKPVGWATGELVKARSWGGNFLLNVAPDSHGELSRTAYRRLEELGSWLQVHGESVFDVEPGPWPERSNVPVTVRGHTWYLHIHQLVDEPIKLRGVDMPAAAYWMRTGDTVEFQRDECGIVYDLPSGLPSTDGDVIAATFP